MAELNNTETVAILPHINRTHIAEYINYGTGAAIWPKQGILLNPNFACTGS